MGSHRIIGAAILAIALCVNVVGLSTPGWLYWIRESFKEDGVVHDGGYRGLFIEVAGNTTTKVQLGWTEVFVSTSHLAGDCLLICAIIAAIYGEVANVKGLPGKAGGLLGFAGVLLILVGLSTFTAYWEWKLIKKRKASWGYSFALSWFSFCLGCVGSVTCYGLHFLVDRRPSRRIPNNELRLSIRP